MRISARGRYGLAAMIAIEKSDSEYVTVISIAKELGLSKIYLEQIFSALRRNGLLYSTKGAQGGYRLAKDASEISAYDILSCLEQTLFEETQDSFSESFPELEKSLHDLIYKPLDNSVKEKLSSISLKALTQEVKENLTSNSNYMYYI